MVWGPFYILHGVHLLSSHELASQWNKPEESNPAISRNIPRLGGAEASILDRGQGVNPGTVMSKEELPSCASESNFVSQRLSFPLGEAGISTLSYYVKLCGGAFSRLHFCFIKLPHLCQSLRVSVRLTLWDFSFLPVDPVYILSCSHNKSGLHSSRYFFGRFFRIFSAHIMSSKINTNFHLSNVYDLHIFSLSSCTNWIFLYKSEEKWWAWTLEVVLLVVKFSIGFRVWAF